MLKKKKKFLILVELGLQPELIYTLCFFIFGILYSSSTQSPNCDLSILSRRLHRFRDMSVPEQSIRIENGVITDDTPLSALKSYLENYVLGLIENGVFTDDTSLAFIDNYLQQELTKNDILRQAVDSLRLNRDAIYNAQNEEDFAHDYFEGEEDPVNDGPAIQKQTASTKAIEGLEKLVIDEKIGDLKQCAVCLEEFLAGDEARRLPCSHLYHTDCIMEWLKDSNTCPMCGHGLPADD